MFKNSRAGIAAAPIVVSNDGLFMLQGEREQNAVWIIKYYLLV